MKTPITLATLLALALPAAARDADAEARSALARADHDLLAKAALEAAAGKPQGCRCDCGCKDAKPCRCDDSCPGCGKTCGCLAAPAPAKPGPEKPPAKTCPCSAECTCGCNDGKPCRCGQTSAAPAAPAFRPPFAAPQIQARPQFSGRPASCGS